MKDKFTLDELLIKVMPGGFLLAVFYFPYRESINILLNKELDFLYTFIFFCSAFITGELLQTIAHEFEWLVDSFYKFRRPSRIFLYKNNPILKSKYKRDEILKYLQESHTNLEEFDIEYKKLSIFNHKKSEATDSLAQSIFWKLYTNVSDLDEIKTFNRNYLFVRALVIEFIIIGIFFLYNNYFLIAACSILIAMVFLWRCRGMARGLVFKTIILNLKS